MENVDQDGLKKLIKVIENGDEFDWRDAEQCVGHYAKLCFPYDTYRFGIDALRDLLNISRTDANRLFVGKRKDTDKEFSLGTTKEDALRYLKSFPKDDDAPKQNNPHEHQLLDMYSSYVQATLLASGIPLPYSKLSAMTMEEFMQHYAPNGVKFTFVKGE